MPFEREGKPLPYGSVGEMSPFRTAQYPQTPFEREGEPLPYGSVGEYRIAAPPNTLTCRSNGRFVNRPYGSVRENVTLPRRLHRTEA